MTKRRLPITAVLMLTLFASPMLLRASGGNPARPEASPTPLDPVPGGGTEGQPLSPRSVTPAPTRTPRGSVSPAPSERPTVTPAVESKVEEAKPTPPRPITMDDLGWLAWLTYWPVLGLFAFLILLALLLHLFHLIRVGFVSRELSQLAVAQGHLAKSASRASATPGKNAAVDNLAAQLNQHGQSLGEFSNRFKQLENRLTISDSQFRDAMHAVALTANWVGQAQLREAFAADGANMSESERASMIAMLERYREPLRSNASRVEPVTQALAELVEKIEGRAYQSPELAARIQSLYEEIGRFDQWQQNTSDQLKSLQRGSLSQRSSMLQADQDRLFDQVNNGSLSVAQMVKQSRAQLDHYFPESPAKGPEQTLPLAEREASLKKIVADAPDYLMDWYDTLFQLQSQVSGGQRTATEAETATDLAKTQQIAREALGKFDIQPEAIQIGQTSYDRRLHEAALVRQSPQFPVNTVIEVHKCGFRKMSTGEVLRRPHVVVAGAAAG